MTIAVIGVSHKTAPLAIRERFAIGREALPEATRELAAEPGVAECLIVSTCNRVEFIAALDGPEADLAGFLCRRFALERQELEPHLYREQDEDAVRHIFRMAASLDSMVLGEAQILGQVKESFAAARLAGALSGPLERLMQSAFAAAKKVRTETAIGSNSVSIASVAVELAQKVFGQLAGKTVLLVGAGKMSELAARHLCEQGVGRILAANRTRARAEQLASSFHGQVVDFERLYETAAEADIVITSTGAPHPIFRREHAQAFLHKRRNRPMFFIDIAVPRDVDPELNKLEGIFVYDVDDLQQVAAAHMDRRAGEAAEAEQLVERELERYRQRQRAVSAAPAIVALRERAEAIRLAELRRMHSRFAALTPEQSEALQLLTRSLVNKFLHPPMHALKEAACREEQERFESLCEVWSLPTAAEETNAAPRKPCKERKQ